MRRKPKRPPEDPPAIPIRRDAGSAPNPLSIGGSVNAAQQRLQVLGSKATALFHSIQAAQGLLNALNETIEPTLRDIANAQSALQDPDVAAFLRQLAEDRAQAAEEGRRQRVREEIAAEDAAAPTAPEPPAPAEEIADVPEKAAATPGEGPQPDGPNPPETLGRHTLVDSPRPEGT